MGDFVSGQGFTSQDRSGPSLAEIARMEREASLKRTTKRKVIRRNGGWHEGWNDYTPGQRLERIHREVARIRTQMRQVQAAFDTIENPNSRQRRKLKRLLASLHREIDGLPTQ